MILYTSMSIALHSGIPTLKIQLKSPSFHKKLKQFAMFFLYFNFPRNRGNFSTRFLRALFLPITPYLKFHLKSWEGHILLWKKSQIPKTDKIIQFFMCTSVFLMFILRSLLIPPLPGTSKNTVCGLAQGPVWEDFSAGQGIWVGKAKMER